MQSVANYPMDMSTAHWRPQPREERLRIPGQPQQRQMKTKSQPNLRAMARRPMPGTGYQAENHNAYRTPRVVAPPLPNTTHRRKHEAMFIEEPPFERPFSPESDSEEHMILDYYLQASYHSPLSRVVSAEEPYTQDGAMAQFDFGLEQPSEPAYTRSQPSVERPRTAHGTKNALSSSKRSSIPRPSPPSPQRQTPSSPQRQSPPMPQRQSYTLFPKEQPQPSTPRISIISDNGSTVSSRQSLISQPRPRTSSLASSERSRSDSCMSVRLQPSAMPSSPSSSPKRPQTSPRMRTPSASSVQQTSVSDKPPSRWSGDTVDMTLESPKSGRNAVDRSRDSSSSTLVATSPAWPTGSFFEDDDEDKLPLRRKVAQKLRSSRSSNALRSASNPTTTGANVEQTHKKSPSWARRLVTWHRA
ncbi:hypothetical protein M436DRAFT_84133 [Aureobasidium namibiae CBS 147.97]|uniref:Uncharacterized protein n=1 Tax=Aureobasidium namibiae CBS 147.97 TaxID=1043004 RepID=A0A074WN75_9PEZI|nr:uncharacterized protein M436DRAFT_84133 [Aureobasidium namibiae CBS 147.97]KEQ71172.1 hypothetical protein M436DRAFT_84133 [Aureobasidium namibiae CBS 147.97]